LLTKKQKADLGIGLATDQDDPSAWIDRQQLLDSYQDGLVKKCQIGCFVLSLGSGELWRPDGIENDEWINNLKESSVNKPFHEQQAPILTYTYRSHSSQYDEDPGTALDLIEAILETVQSKLSNTKSKRTK
jgi:hypothetical protein